MTFIFVIFAFSVSPQQLRSKSFSHRIFFHLTFLLWDQNNGIQFIYAAPVYKLKSSLIKNSKSLIQLTKQEPFISISCKATSQLNL